MVNGLNEKIQKLVFDLKENMNKQIGSKRIQTNIWMKLRRLSRIGKMKSIKKWKP
jgi:hypothetical protein